MWKGLAVVTNSESPIVVVLSESMEPAFQRGDLLLLSMFSNPVRVGDICVFKIDGKVIPIVHRVLEVHDNNTDGKQYLLTKGDNNPVDDRGLYNRGQMWVSDKEVVGRVSMYMPYIGMVTIILNDYPQLKVVLLAVMGIFVLITKEVRVASK
ncbi:signal peptidase I [Rhizoclosmatium globosum]|uniref:Signal peptidase complex catalytic subunit SEC11 n=1 Tax=Rhizoclosmatium globosum TaxID=329046 RepID=A0A1Y2CAK1_9FUNG|nr:signal peptidase I [Rhizoclosmatium globosum]|eukprot:ORY44060.1 signal peptidase I [Rhizoclosmatium globosum]